MPSGAKPKIYPPELVDVIRELYDSGLSQVEVAEKLGLTQKVVWNLMRRHDIARRPRVKRDQRGPANATWRADRAAYAALHKRVEVARGRPRRCERCGVDEDRRYEWANLTGHYEDVDDYQRMCAKCHRRFDAARRKAVIPT